MPPFETVPNAHYACEIDVDFESLMERARQGELNVWETLHPRTHEPIAHLFAPHSRENASDLVISAQNEGIIPEHVYGRLIMENGEEI